MLKYFIILEGFMKNIILTVLFLLLFIWAFFIEPNMLTVTKYQVQDKELSGIKIVFVSDLHIKPHQKKRLQEIIGLINNQNADMVLCGGDLVSGHNKLLTMPIEKIAIELQNIKSKYGFYTILGNHDQYIGTDYIIETLKNNKINVLYNSNVKVNVNGKDIYIAGIQYKPKNMIPIEKSLENTKSPVIMLTHSPDEIKKIPNSVNLILAGHTHGGQIVIPVIGPILTGSQYHNLYAYGQINENGKKLITTRGIGVSILPFRLNCPPEIVVIEFK